jgi:hypothetical protein
MNQESPATPRERLAGESQITDMVTKPQFGGHPFSIASLALSTQDCAVRVVVDTAASVRKIRHDNSVF